MQCRKKQRNRFLHCMAPFFLAHEQRSKSNSKWRWSQEVRFRCIEDDEEQGKPPVA
jgi:hypothetical protein